MIQHNFETYVQVLAEAARIHPDGSLTAPFRTLMEFPAVCDTIGEATGASQTAGNPSKTS
jgi:hypothetical protein